MSSPERQSVTDIAPPTSDIDNADPPTALTGEREAADETDGSAVADSDGEPGPLKGGEENRAPKARRLVRAAIRWTAPVVCAVVLAAAAYEGWLLLQRHQQDVSAAEALSAAQGYAVTLTSTDPETVDHNVTEILNGATADFKDRYAKSSADLRKMLVDNKVTTKGTVVASAVKHIADDSKVEVLLLVRQEVRSAKSPEPRIDVTPVVITMEKVDGRWLASTVDLPGAPA